jgi:hypothetical protein
VRPQLSQKIADKLVECIVKEIELGNTLLNYEIDPLANENNCPSQKFICTDFIDISHGAYYVGSIMKNINQFIKTILSKCFN